MTSIDSTEGFDDTTMEMLSANLPSSAFTTNTPDPRLERARQEMERTNQITPLLKEELRLRILSKRLEKGEPEIEINSGEPRNYELTEEEQAKRERRKAQNRRAAKKCREKRKMKTLSDAEKYRLIREQNQQLRNDVTYMRHKEDVYKKFCIDHILHQQCFSAPSDEAIRRQLLALLGSDCNRRNKPEETISSSTFESVSELHLQQTHLRSTYSNAADLHSNYQSQVSFATTSIPTTTAHTAFHADQPVSTIEELKMLPVHEISSLLQSDFSVSDQSLESTPPELSPTSLFSNVSPIDTNVCEVATTSYFSHLTPNTSSYSSNNTSAFSTSNDSVFVESQANNDTHNNTSFLDSRVHDLHRDMSVEFLEEDIYSDNTISKNVLPGASHDVTTSTTSFTSRKGWQSDHGDQNSCSVVSCAGSTTDGNVFSVAVNNNVVNTFLNDLPSYPQPFLSNYLKLEQFYGMTESCSRDSVVQTVAISPLTPLSPPSPNLPLPPVSPNIDTNRKDGSYVHIHSGAPTSYGAVSPARPVVRRMSSTTSVPSPFYNHHVSIALSPPPSVPSPTSNGVPESPPILVLSPACAASSYTPHVSSFSEESSTNCSPARFSEVSEEEFN